MTSPAYNYSEWTSPGRLHTTSTDEFIDELFAAPSVGHLRAVPDAHMASDFVRLAPCPAHRTQVGISPPQIGRIVLLVAAIIAMFFFLMPTGVQAESQAPSTTSHLVRQGDTLWDLAIDITPTGGDVRAVVALIRDANAMTTSMLVAGDLIEIPVLP